MAKQEFVPECSPQLGHCLGVLSCSDHSKISLLEMLEIAPTKCPKKILKRLCCPFLLEQFSPRSIRWDKQGRCPKGCRRVSGIRDGAGELGADVGCQAARGVRRAPIGASEGMRAWMWGVRASVG